MFNILFSATGKYIVIAITLLMLQLTIGEQFIQEFTSYSYIWTAPVFQMVTRQNSQFFLQAVLFMATINLIRNFTRIRQ